MSEQVTIKATDKLFFEHNDISKTKTLDCVNNTLNNCNGVNFILKIQILKHFILRIQEYKIYHKVHLKVSVLDLLKTIL